MNARELGLSQVTSSSIAEISERTGQRIDAGNHRSNRGQVQTHTVNLDPLSAVWESELEPMLRGEPRLKPMTLFEYLQEQYPGQYPQVLRTLQRRVSTWKALHGPAPEVMFMLRHEPGVMGLSDFTKLKGMEITVNGEPFEHLIYHYRLAYSGWQYAQIIQGGESFIGLSEGLQNALFASGGAPKEHRTDSLSAAYRNLGGHRTSDLTRLYDDLCDHYRMTPTRNNKGIAHENGAVESPHGHLKNRIKQAIYLRGSGDFATVADYQAVIDKATAGLNRQCEAKFEQEKAALQPLPQRRVADYEVLSARVSCYSTIDIRCILYSVPSRLIGRALEIHLYHDRLVGYFARQQVFELSRLRASGKGRRRGRCIDYRHLIDGLRKKPRAFLFCQWQNDLLPSDEFRQLWMQLKTSFERDHAAVLIVEALYIGATYDQEKAVVDFCAQAVTQGTLTLASLQQQFMPTLLATIAPIETQQHALDSYDQLLSFNRDTDTTDATDNPCAGADGDANDILPSQQPIPAVASAAQTAQTQPNAHPLGSYREPSFTAAMVLCAVLVNLMRERSRQTPPNAVNTGHPRSAVARRKKFNQL
jgi:hypothetical protein